MAMLITSVTSSPLQHHSAHDQTSSATSTTHSSLPLVVLNEHSQVRHALKGHKVGRNGQRLGVRSLRGVLRQTYVHTQMQDTMSTCASVNTKACVALPLSASSKPMLSELTNSFTLFGARPPYSRAHAHISARKHTHISSTRMRTLGPTIRIDAILAA